MDAAAGEPQDLEHGPDEEDAAVEGVACGHAATPGCQWHPRSPGTRARRHGSPTAVNWPHGAGGFLITLTGSSRQTLHRARIARAWPAQYLTGLGGPAYGLGS